MRHRRVTIFIGESDQWHHRPLYLAILEHLKAAGCAGATVTRGAAGFGAHSEIHTATILRLSIDLPVIITAVDTPEKIERVLPEIAEMLSGGMILVDETDVYFHSAAFRGGLPDISVGDVMTANPEAVEPSTPIAEIVERLAGHDYTALPVVDEQRRIIGVISDTDMLGARLTGLSVSLHKVIGPDLVAEYLTRLKRAGKTACDAMTTPAVTVTPATSIRDAAHLMHVKKLKRLPVVDDQNRLVGVLGRLDIFQSIASGYARRTAPPAIQLPQEHRTVAQVMERDVVTVPENAPLADVVGKLLTSNGKRAVVVDQRGRPIGIVTDSDIVARVDPEDRPGIITSLRSRWNEAAHRQVRRAYGQRAADLMTAPVVTVLDTASVIEALTLTVERHVKRVPVIDAQNRLVGVVSRTALLAASLDLAGTQETV